MKKYESLQILRAIAAWMVVYHHFMQLYFSFKSETAIGAFFSKHGNFGVDIFFVLSGFVMYFSARKENLTASQFTTNRIFRIVPVYWFYTAVMIFAIAIFPTEFSYTDYNLKSLLLSLFFIPGPNPSGLGAYPLLTVGWTLNFEMFFYAVLAVSLWINKKFAIPLCFAIIFLLPLTYPKGTAYSTIASSFLLFEFLAGFLIGVITSNNRINELFIIYRSYAILLMSTLTIIFIVSLKVHWFFKIPLAGAIVFLAILIDPIINKQSYFVKKLVRLGDESYSTYLVHAVLISIFLHFTGKNFSNPVQWMIIAAISVSVWLASSASHRYIEKSQHLENIRKILLKRIRPSTSAIKS